MNRKWLGPKRVLLLVSVVCLVAVSLPQARRHEPGFQGQPLSYWTEHLAGTDFARSYDAIRAIGAESIPWLLGRAQSAHTVPRRCYLAVWPKLPTGLRKLFRPLPPPSVVEENVTYALSLLDLAGVPGLVAAFAHPNEHIRRVAALSIGRMLMTKPVVVQSVPGLAKLLVDPDESVRMAALGTLEKMESGANGAVPTLIEVLSDTRSETMRTSGLGCRGLAARILGRMGPEAAAAVPKLTELLKAPEHELRSQAAIALWRVTRDPKMATVLTKELEAGGLVFWPDILVALGEMGPAAKEAAPVLLKSIKAPQANSRTAIDSEYALWALGKIDPAAAEEIKQAQEKTQEAELIRRLVAGRAAERAQATKRLLWESEAARALDWQAARGRPALSPTRAAVAAQAGPND